MEASKVENTVHYSVGIYTILVINVDIIGLKMH